MHKTRYLLRNDVGFCFLLLELMVASFYELTYKFLPLHYNNEDIMVFNRVICCEVTFVLSFQVDILLYVVWVKNVRFDLSGEMSRHVEFESLCIIYN